MFMKKLIIVLPLIIFAIFFLIMQKDNLVKKDKTITTKEFPEAEQFDCPYIEKNIGEEYGGGVVAHCNKDGKSGLIATQLDQSTETPWGCNGFYIDNTSNKYREGENNTLFVTKGCPDRPIAASICQDLSLNRYDDWLLPSQEELNYLYLNKNKIKGFSNVYYWSSTENNFTSAMRQSFSLGVQNSSNKNGTYRVRCIRYF